jgi:hypothetical protein
VGLAAASFAESEAKHNVLHSPKSLNRRIVMSPMDPYAKPGEKKVGAKRPKISHLPSALETRTRRERLAEKQAVAAERRAIKKSARRHLKQALLSDLNEG